ncbi:nuclear envelope pore membrane protein POM 121C [Suncus etruscus]|uniref:nuclear envelope pore membrane protein POM 121C n=1 Tax=Suncus etruscus TaxID=109475 RepID=UPI00210F82BC|nr:nuclear envelope pore membrane protein POM 121C [Suncus etruscus]
MCPAAAAGGGGERRRPIASGRDGRGRGRGGAALAGLCLLGFVLYLVPAAAALAWLALGASAAWWALSGEPSGPRALSLARGPARRRPPRAPAKSAANGSLAAPPSALAGPDRAELLLMGSYLGKPGPPAPAPRAHAQPRSPDLRERPGRRPPDARPHHPQHPHLTPARPSPLRPAGPLAPRDCGTLPNRFVITPRRHYPIQQTQYSLLGVLPTVCWNGYHKKAVLSARNSKMVCSPVTVRIAPPDSRLARTPLSEQGVSSPLSSPSSNTPDPCAKETVLSALRERKKRAVEEEDHIFAEGQENKRRRHDSSGSGHSAFEPLVANGVPAAFVPKPGSLKRGLTSQTSEDHLHKRSRTSSLSSMTSTCTGGIPSSSRNAISSSYSSSRGCAQLWKRSGPSSSPFSSPASSRSQTPERPAKKMREEELAQPSSSSTPLVTDKESQGEKLTDPASAKNPSSFSSPTAPVGSGQRKRKIQLLPSRRGDQLALPPPPQLGYTVTAEDLDLEKKASLQWFNKVLEEQPDPASGPASENTPAPQTDFTLTMPPAETVAPVTALPTPSASPNPLLESLKKMQSSPEPPTSSGTTSVATSEAPEAPKTPSLLSPLATTQPAPLPVTSEDSKPSVTFLGLTSASSTIPVTEPPKSPLTTAAEPAAPAAPKQSLLLGMLSTPTSNPSTSMAPGMSSTSLTFKPIFETPPKSEAEDPSPACPSKAATVTPASSNSVAPTTTSISSPTFKPIFDGLGQPASVPLITPFSFVPTPSTTTTTTTTTTTSTPLFVAQTSATVSAPAATASTAPASATKAAFAFTMSSSVSTSSSTAAASSQPFLFGTSQASGASFTPSLGSVFQFGKPPAVPTTTTTTTGQPLPSAPPASSSSSFSGFGSTLTTSTPAATSQATLTFSTTTPAFNIPFSSATKAPLPSYPGATPQLTFGATDGQSQGTAKPVLAPSFGTSFTFGNPTAPTPAQPTFDSTTQYSFGALKPAASAFGAPATTQPAFGNTTSVFSFGAVTTSGFGTTTQTPSSGAGSSLFGSTAPAPFTFGSSAAPAASGGFGINVANPGASSTAGAFNFGTGQSGTTTTGAAPFGGGLSQNPLAASSQSTPFAFNVGSTSESKPMFGGTSTPTFGQNNPTPGVGTSGSSLSFGASSTSTQGFVGVGPFGSAAPSFSIGAGSKTTGARQRLQARRQHTRKK